MIIIRPSFRSIGGSYRPKSSSKPSMASGTTSNVPGLPSFHEAFDLDGSAEPCTEPQAISKALVKQKSQITATGDNDIKLLFYQDVSRSSGNEHEFLFHISKETCRIESVATFSRVETECTSRRPLLHSTHSTSFLIERNAIIPLRFWISPSPTAGLFCRVVVVNIVVSAMITYL
jgi:hypothetical protein